MPDYPPNPGVDQQHAWLGGPKGSSYRTEAQSRRIKEYCSRRDGAKCVWCGRVEDDLRFFEVHHVALPVSNNYSDNVQLMHPQCNKDARWGHPKSQAVFVHRTPTPRTEGAEHAGLLPSSLERLGDERTTPSQATNLENEVEFRRAAFKAVLEMYDPAFKHPDKYLNRRELMSCCMEVSGASQDAAYGYVRRLFAMRVGPLVEETELGGKIKTAKFRHAGDDRLTLEQLVAKYPKEGNAYSH